MKFFEKSWKKFQKITFTLEMSTKGRFWTPKMGPKSTHFGGPKSVIFCFLLTFLRKTRFFKKSENFQKNFHGFLKNERKNRNFQNFSFFDIFYTVKSIDKILKISKKTENFRFFSKIFENFWKFRWRNQRKKIIFCRKNRFFSTTQL